jgi:hypothetical protein
MDSKTPMQNVLQLAFDKSYYVDNGTSDDPQVIEMVDLEQIIQSMMAKESTLIAEHRLMKEALTRIKSVYDWQEDLAGQISNETLKNITL